MLSPDFLFSRFLWLPPANPSNFHTVQMLLWDLFPCFSVRLSNVDGGVIQVLYYNHVSYSDVL